MKQKVVVSRVLLVSLLLSSLLVIEHGFAAEQDYDSLIQQSLTLRNSGEFAAAEAVLRQAYDIPEETNEVSYLLAMVLAFQEKFIESSQLLNEALERYPLDLQLILAKARVLSYQGIYDQSIEVANSVLEVMPDNTEARNLLARVYFYQRRYSEARRAFQMVLSSEPDNLESIIGLYDTERAAGNEAEAESLLDRAELIAPGHIDIVTRRNGVIETQARPHALSYGYSVSDFDQSSIDQWYDRFFEYRYQNAASNQFYIRGEHARRFGSSDSLIEIGSVIKRSNDLLFEFSIAHTDEASFLPKDRLRIGTTFRLHEATENLGSTTLGVSLTNSEYNTGTVRWLKLDLTHYLLNLDAWLTPGIGIVEDEFGMRTTGWNLGAHWQTNPRLRLGYTYTDAPETENNITTETVSNHLYANYLLNDSFSLRLDLSQNERENSYTRESIAVSLLYRF